MTAAAAEDTRDTGEAAASYPVAITGIGCRFPQAHGPRQFWQVLLDGRDCIAARSPQRVGDHRPGGYLEEVLDLDPSYFSVSDREASRMDPQQALLLETAWEALEDAAIAPLGLAGARVGVFVGVCAYEHGAAALFGTLPDIHTATGSALSVAAGRLSYVFGLTGPAVVLDTACSSSLAAVHYACASIRSGDCDWAIAGGVNVIAGRAVSDAFDRGGFLAPGGRCRSFGAGADGYVRGEGVGLVVLEPLAAARQRGRRVYAVVQGSAIGHDGRSNGLTAPSRRAQEEVVRAALRRSGVDPADVDCVEAHGSGTALGDPIEAAALGAVVGGAARIRPCLIGSVKSNIGHLEAAAGIAGLIKTTLAIHHGVVPASLHAAEINPRIDLAQLNLEVVQDTRSWPGNGSRIAGVSSFGFSGTNVHVVLVAEAAAGAEERAHERSGSASLLLSAPDEGGVRELAARLADAVTSGTDRAGETALTDLAWILATGRSHLACRAGFVASSTTDAVAGLRALASGAPARNVALVHAPRRTADGPLFVYSGQGGQWSGMAQELRGRWAPFDQALQDCDRVFRDLLPWSLADLLASRLSADELARPEIAQPLIFAVQVAMTRALADAGVRPAAVVGHSMGEVAGAYAVGALTLQDAARVIVARAEALRQTSSDGALAVIGLPASDATAVAAGVDEELQLVAENGPESTVVGGPVLAVSRLIATARSLGLFANPVSVTAAAHSAALEPFLEEFRERIADIAPRNPLTPFFPASTCGDLPGDGLTAKFWTGNLRNPVRFWPALRAALEADPSAVVEISPHPVLVRDIRAALAGKGSVATCRPVMRRDEPAWPTILDLLVGLHLGGANVDWRRVLAAGQPTSLPGPAWRHRAATSVASGSGTASRRMLDDEVPIAGCPGLAIRRLDIRSVTEGPLVGHVVHGIPVVPGTALLAALLAAGTLAVRDVSIERPVAADGESAGEVQVVIRRAADGNRLAVQSSRDGDRWITHATAVAAEDRGQGEEPAPEPADAEPVDLPAYYAAAAAAGLHLSPELRALVELKRAPGRAWATIELSRSVSAHPDGLVSLAALLDAGLHVLGAAAGQDKSVLLSPTGAAAVRVAADRITRCRVSAVVTSIDARGVVTGDITVSAFDGAPLHRLDGVRLTPLPGGNRPWAIRELRWAPASPQDRAEAADRPARTIAAVPPDVDSDLVIAVGADVCVPVDDAGAVVDLMTDGGQRSRLVVLPSDVSESAEPGVGHEHVLALLQELLRRDAAPRLVAVTRGVHVLPGRHEIGRPRDAPLWGILRVLANESPELRPSLIDLPDAPTKADLAMLAAALDRDAPELAIRGGQLLVPFLAPVSVPLAPATVRTDRTYVVTGGLGALGRQVVGWLVHQGARSVAVITRRGAADPPAVLGGGLDADIRVVRGDVGSRASLAAALDQVRKDMPPIGGVVHAAGRIHDGVIAGLDMAGSRAAFDVEARGAWLLHNLTLDDPVEVFVLFSSLAGLLGSPGQAAHAAGSAYLDALAAHRMSLGLPAQSLDWGPWRGAGAGAAAAERVETVGVRAVTVAEGVQIFGAALGYDRSVLVLADLDEQKLAKVLRRSAYVSRVLPEASRTQDGIGRPITLDSAGRLVRDVASQVLRVPRDTISNSVELTTLGLDSLMSLEFRDLLQTALGVPLPASLTWAYPTVRSLAEALVKIVQTREGT